MQTIQMTSGHGHTVLYEGEADTPQAKQAFNNMAALGRQPFDTTDKGEGAKTMDPPNYSPDPQEITFIARLAGGQ